MEAYNPFSLKEKNILVTGASSGIGRGIAIECSKMGAQLIITGRNENRLKETMSLLEGKGHKTIIADLTEQGGLASLVDQLPKLDGLVLNAGIVELKPISFATQRHFENIYKINLFAPIELFRLIVKKKLYNSGFSVVTIDSVAGSFDFAPGNSIYGSGKAALKSFLKYASLEYCSKNVRINTISPGMVLTPLVMDGEVDSVQLEKVISDIPINRWGKPEDIAFATVFLLSSASSYITGIDIIVDGGYTIPFHR